MVNTLHATYSKYIEQIQLVRDVLEGGSAVKQLKYLPALQKQTAKEYAAMIARPAFDNFTSRVLDAYTGLAFAKQPFIDIPSKLDLLMSDIDLNDSTHIDLAQEVVSELFTAGRVGVLVDVLQDTPFAKIYPNESIINWRTTNNQLSLVVLREKVEAPINEFQVEYIEEYLVLALDEEGKYYARRYRLKEEKSVQIGEPLYITQNGQKMDYIPFFVANPASLSIEVSKPPLFDISSQNISLLKLKTDLYHGYFFTIPTPYGVGISNQDFQFSIGVTEAHIFERPDSDLRYLEFKGEGLSQIKTELQEIKKDMAALGAEFLRDTSNSNESTETVAMRTSADRATLISIVDTASRLMTKVIQEMAKWKGLNPNEVSYKINTDYNLTNIDAQLLNAYAQLHQTAIISDYDMYHILRKGEVIDEELTFRDWLEYKQNSSVSI